MGTEPTEKHRAAAVPYDSGGNAQTRTQRGLPDFERLLERATQLNARGDAAGAAQLYRAWLADAGSDLVHVAYFNLGVILADIGDLPGAQAAYGEAIRVLDGFIEPRLNLADVLERMGRVDEAVTQWRWVSQAVSPSSSRNRPLLCLALNQLGRVLEDGLHDTEALGYLTDSLMLEPRQAGALQHWVALRQKLCLWPVYAPFGEISIKDMRAATSAMSMLALTDDPQQQHDAAQRFVANTFKGTASAEAWRAGYGHARLRIGYCSSDLCEHPVAMLIAELLELHDRERFEVFAYCWSPRDGSALRDRVIRAIDHLVRIDELSDLQAAQRIRADEIDIVIDLHGQTAGARPILMAQRAAPVQISFLGFPGTSAIPGVDWVVVDQFVVPPVQREFLAESPLEMPQLFQVSDRQRDCALPPTRADVGLPAGAVVLACFNRPDKFTPEVFAAWMRILQRVPHAVLWLLCDNVGMREQLQRHVHQSNIEVERIFFIQRLKHADYLARIPLADLFLDTFPFNGGATANDILWAGVPVLTLCGRSFASRMAGSLLHAAQIPGLISYTLEDYENTAVVLAHQPDRLRALRAQVQALRSSGCVFDTARWVRAWELALQRLAKGWGVGAP